MATIVESLFVELGLDTKQFDASQKKSVKQLKDFEEQAKKTTKNTKEDAESLAFSFEKVGKSLLALGGISLGLTAFRDFITTTVTGNASLGRTARLLDMSARELDAWGGAAKSVGGDAKDMTATFQTLQGQMTALKMGQGNTDFLTALSQLGGNLAGNAWKTGKVNIFELGEALKNFQDKFGPQEAKNIANRLGMNETAFFLLVQGKDKLHALYDEMERGSGVMPENTAAAERLQKQWAGLAQAASGLGQSIFRTLTPAMTDLLDKTTKLVESGSGGILKSWASSVAHPMDTTWSFTKWVAHQISNGFGGSGGNRTSSGQVTGSAGGDAPRNVRNNNPGNIEYGAFAKSNGATGSDGRFAIFPTMEAGRAAQAALIQSKYSSGLDTISKLISGSGGVLGWLGGGKDLKDAPGYIADLVKNTGIDKDKHLEPGQLSSVQAAMAMHEGMTGQWSGLAGSTSTSTAQTTIQTVNIYTQATDANGIAKDLHGAVSDHSFVGAGLAGAQ